MVKIWHLNIFWDAKIRFIYRVFILVDWKKAKQAQRNIQCVLIVVTMTANNDHESPLESLSVDQKGMHAQEHICENMYKSGCVTHLLRIPEPQISIIITVI